MQSEDLELDELWHIIIICHIRMSELYVYISANIMLYALPYGH